MNIKEITLATAILGVAVAIFGIEQTQAADLHGGMKDQSIEVPAGDVVDWTGLSIGVQGGVTNANHDVKASRTSKNDDEVEITRSVELDGLSAAGLSGRIFGQYDLQLGSDWVIGARAWYGLTNAKVELTATGEDKQSAEEQENYGGVVRLGRLLGSEHRALLYGLGGWEHVSYDLKPGLGDNKLATGDFFENHPSFNGPVAGLGMEYALSRAVFVSLEYQHFFGGTQDIQKIESVKVEDRLDIDSVHAGLRLKF